MTEVTVGIDIGTTSVKALAVDGDGEVLARARVPHDVYSPTSDAFEHKPDTAWRANVLKAFSRVSERHTVKGVNVAAMVPSLCAVDAKGKALTPGLLYGDRRGGEVSGANPSDSGELVNFLAWCAAEAPNAAGFWPAQAVANHALTGVGGIDTVTAMTTLPLFDFTGWDEAVAEEAGATTKQLPKIVSGSDAIGITTVASGHAGATVGGGTIDAFAEQLVSGAAHDGDVLVICGTTLVLWAVIPEWREVEGLWTVPHTEPGKTLIGGASNAGGLFLGWANSLLPEDDEPLSSSQAIPVWEPYVRGERTPLHDPDRRAAVHFLDRTMGPNAVRRGAYEASGFALRHHLDLAGVEAKRLVVTGGGAHVAGWVQALADATNTPADVVAVPEGGAYGAAYLARVTAGLESDASGARRWAKIDRRIEPDPAWSAAMHDRYAQYRVFADGSGH